MRAKSARRRAAVKGKPTRAARRRAAVKGKPKRAARRRSRPKTDEEYVMEAARLFAAMSPDLLAADLDAANAARSGRGWPLEYPPLMIAALAVMRTRPGMTLRFLAGVGRAMCPWAGTLHHTTLERRFEAMSLSGISRVAHGSGITLRDAGWGVGVEACDGGHVVRREGAAEGVLVATRGGIPTIQAVAGIHDCGAACGCGGRRLRPAERVAIDGTGFEPTNGGAYRRVKWNGGGYTGFVRVVAVAGVETGVVLGATVTDERVSEQQAMRQAVLAAMDTGLLLPGTEVLADAAFCGEATIKFLESHGLVPIIRMSLGHCRPRGSRARRRLIRGQFLGPRARANESACDVPVGVKAGRQRRWMRRWHFEDRLAIERVFSTVKRMFGSCMRSRKWGNIVREVAMKLAVHNMLCAA